MKKAAAWLAALSAIALVIARAAPREWASMKWTKTFLPRRHKSPSPACPFCWAGSFAFDGALQDVRIAAKKSSRCYGGRMEEGNGTKARPDAALSGALCVLLR